MSVPHVTITVTGDSAKRAVADIDTLRESLYMVYYQAVKGEVRRQWIIFPPALAELDVNGQTVASSAGKVRALYREQRFEGNRSKWFHSVKTSASLQDEADGHEADGWTVSKPVPVPLEVDDYAKVWQGETAHKAIRAIDRTIQTVLNTTTK